MVKTSNMIKSQQTKSRNGKKSTVKSKDGKKPMVKKYNRIKSQQHVRLYKVQLISVT